MKWIINVLVVVLLLGHCISARMRTAPTKKDAIKQYKQHKKLKARYKTANPEEQRHILRQMDSLKRIKNPYKFIK